MRTSSEQETSTDDRRYRRAIVRETERRVGDPAWLARAAGVGLCVAALGFVGLFFAPIAMFGQVGLFLSSLPKQFALALPPVIVVFAVGTSVGAGLGWWKRYWSLRTRIHQTVLALLGIGFVWQLWLLGLL